MSFSFIYTNFSLISANLPNYLGNDIHRSLHRSSLKHLNLLTFEILIYVIATLHLSFGTKFSIILVLEIENG